MIDLDKTKGKEESAFILKKVLSHFHFKLKHIFIIPKPKKTYLHTLRLRDIGFVIKLVFNYLGMFREIVEKARKKEKTSNFKI